MEDSKEAMIATRGKKNDSLYLKKDGCGFFIGIESKEDSNLWYHTLGYKSIKGLKIMHSNRKLLRLKLVEIDMCESCTFGKQKRVNFKKIDKISKGRET